MALRDVFVSRRGGKQGTDTQCRALPAALVGTMSNIKYLTEKVPFLGWINDLPKVVLGLISGLLPAVALAMLMAIVPMIMRGKSFLPPSQSPPYFPKRTPPTRHTLTTPQPALVKPA